jgi:hypothetical protein
VETSLYAHLHAHLLPTLTTSDALTRESCVRSSNKNDRVHARPLPDRQRSLGAYATKLTQKLVCSSAFRTSTTAMRLSRSRTRSRPSTA